MAEFAACTIIAKHQLAAVRVLAKSWHAYNRGKRIFVLLLDSPQGLFSPEDEPFTCISLGQLNIPNLAGFLFRYSCSECRLAIRPYLLKYLLSQHSLDGVVYLDPDILVFTSFASLLNRLLVDDVLLVPYLLAPMPHDGRVPTEDDIIERGVFNLGCLGFRRSENSLTALTWLEKKLGTPCVEDLHNGVTVNPQWFNLLPSLFDRVQIVRDPAYDVGYWNLHERHVQVADNITVNGTTLASFQFSNFNPDIPWDISRDQNRFTMSSIGEARVLYHKYSQALIQEGWYETHVWSYDHDFFGDGTRISDSTRRHYCRLELESGFLGDPFKLLRQTDSP